MKVLLMMLTAIIIVSGISGISAETPKTQYTIDTIQSNSVEQKGAESISVDTDKTNYNGIEIMEVSGFSTITPVIIKVIAPNGNLITIAQVDTDEAGNYYTNITVGGKLYNSEGIYTITTTSQGFEDSTMIGYGNISQASLSDITYTISGASVSTISNDPEALSITVELTDANGGEIILTLPRDVIDSTIDGVDEIFFVLVDGYESQYTEVTTDVQRILTIPFSAESESIEIIGTFVVPEFGTIAMMILVLTIISVVVVTKKTRLVAN